MGRPKKEKPTHSTGMYVYKATVGHNFDGTPIRKAFYSSTSKDAAKAKANQYMIDLRVAEAVGVPFMAKEECFDTWAKKVLDTLKGTVKDSSYNLTYKNSVIKHLIPYFGKRKINEIKQIDIQEYFKIKGRSYTVETLKKHKMALNKIFETAVINDVCVKNPCIDIKLLSNKKSAEKQTYNKEQCRLVIEYSKTHRFGLGINLMLEYGISRSELLGLKWADVDTINKQISINRGVTDVQNAATNKMEVVIGEPKNSFRKRVIPIKDETLELIMSNQNDSDFIICNAKKMVCSPRTWSRRHYDVFMTEMHEYYVKKEIDIPILTPHELRHTRATIWVNDGENLFAVADILGHSDLKMLRKRYAHADTESVRKLLKLN